MTDPATGVSRPERQPRPGRPRRSRRPRPHRPPAGSPPPTARRPGPACLGPPPPAAARAGRRRRSPGLIPLRPLTLGPILGASFQVMRRNPRATFGLVADPLRRRLDRSRCSIAGLVLVVALQRVANARAGRRRTRSPPGALGIAAHRRADPGRRRDRRVRHPAGRSSSLEVARGTLGEKLKLRGLVRMARGPHRRADRLVGAARWRAVVVGHPASSCSSTVALGVAIRAPAASLAGGLLALPARASACSCSAAWLGVKTSLRAQRAHDRAAAACAPRSPARGG